MPTTIYTPEFPSVTGVLDEDALVVGHFADAHVLRSIGNASNRLAGRGNYLVHEVFRRGGNDEQIGTTGFYAGEQWQKLRSFPLLERKPHLTRADVRIRARITSGSTVVFQLETGSIRFRDSAKFATVNTIVAVGTGNFELYTGQIELGRSLVEDIHLWAYGDATNTLINTAVYGSPATGSMNSPTLLTAQRQFYVPGNTWNTSISTDRVMIAFFDSLNQSLFAPQPVSYGFQSVNGQVLYIGEFGRLQLTSEDVQSLTRPGATFALWQASIVRLSSITIRERDAYAA